MRMNPVTSSMEYLELKNMLLQQQAMLNMFIPIKTSIAHLVGMTGKSRQAIRQYIIANYEPDVDFWTEHGKIYTTKDVATQIMLRSMR